MWDLINGFFELFGGGFITLSCIKLLRDKKVRGVSPVHVTYFTLWGFWNLAYYPHLKQWTSFVGGAVVVLVNVFWLTLLVYYIRKEKNDKNKNSIS